MDAAEKDDTANAQNVFHHGQPSLTCPYEDSGTNHLSTCLRRGVWFSNITSASDASAPVCGTSLAFCLRSGSLGRSLPETEPPARRCDGRRLTDPAALRDNSRSYDLSRKIDQPAFLLPRVLHLSLASSDAIEGKARFATLHNAPSRSRVGTRGTPALRLGWRRLCPSTGAPASLIGPGTSVVIGFAGRVRHTPSLLRK